MANEFDRKVFPDFVQTAFAISLGACYKSLEMMKAPQQTIPAMFTEMKTLLTIPSDADNTLKGKAQALAAVWMEKGATYMEQCKSAGLKFTDAQ